LFNTSRSRRDDRRPGEDDQRRKLDVPEGTTLGQLCLQCLAGRNLLHPVSIRVRGEDGRPASRCPQSRLLAAGDLVVVTEDNFHPSCQFNKPPPPQWRVELVGDVVKLVEVPR
jgi:hypothetical protein